jgi:hypothetical protein
MNGFKNGRPNFISQKLLKKTRRKLVVIPEGEYETHISSSLHAQSSPHFADFGVA